MVIKKASKCYIKDINGFKMIDTTMGSGAQIIGHNNPLIKKISKQIKKGTIYTIPNVHTDEVNYYLKTYINPNFHNEYIFCNSGTEANMRAIRLARAYTGKDKIGRFHGGWHGGLDGFLEEHPDRKGIPSDVDNLFKVLPIRIIVSYHWRPSCSVFINHVPNIIIFKSVHYKSKWRHILFK